MAPRGLVEEKTPLLRDHGNSITRHVNVDNEEAMHVAQKLGATPNNGFEGDLTKEEVPRDRWNIVYFIFFLQGIGMLFPWNAFITAKEYFDVRLAGSPYKQNWENYFTMSFQISNLLGLIAVMLSQHRLSLKWRIQIPLGLQLVIFVLTTILVPLDLDPDFVFWITVPCISVAGFCTSFLQGGMFGLGGTFPIKYIQAIMGGQGLGGVLVSVISIFCLMGTDDTETSALVFFSISTAIVVMCVVSYVILLQLDFVKFHLKQRAAQGSGTRKRNFDYWSVWRRIAPLAVSVFFTFWVTLSLFPGVTSQVVSSTDSDDPFFHKYFIPFYCFVLFNVGDYGGRMMAAWKQTPKNGPVLYAFSAIRIIFIPLFILCNFDHSSIVVFKNDAFPITFMIIMSLSNGYLGSLAMMYGPGALDERRRPEDANEDTIQVKECGGAIMVFFLTLGLSLGTVTSFGLQSIVCHFSHCKG